jgi:thioredoxin-like negative regulator of GroEL
MMKSKSLTRWLGPAALLVAALAPAARGGSNARSFEEIKALAASQDRPILLKVGTSWCSSCKAFDAAVESDAAFRGAIAERAILHQVDAENGAGVDISKAYAVAGYPTFILANSSGETMDRWMGFEKKDGTGAFLKTMNEALADPTTIAQKLERFRENPTEADARKLGDLRQYEGYPAEAIAYYRRAQELNPDAETDYDLRVFGATARGWWTKLFSAEQVREQADVVFAAVDPTPEAMFEVLYTMNKVSHKTGDRALALPYLEMAVERTEGVEDEKIAHKRAYHLADYALHIEKNEKKAIQARKASLPEDWMEQANQLNNFAWWCFENEINLDEAEALARRGIELAAPGTEKANILDTLAEICNVKDDCANAVEYIRLAIAEDPENEYFQKQLHRFEEILALQD